MKSKLLDIIITALILFCLLNAGYGQAPNLGTTSSFALYTAAGSFANLGATNVTGDIGTNTAIPTGFPPGTLVGNIYQAGDGVSAQAAADAATAYSDLSGTACGTVIGTTLGNGQVLTAGIYCQGAASTLNGNLTLDGQGDPNALFIIKIDGAFSTSVASKVILTNSASLCNVYWQINGQFDLGDSSVFMGTVIASGAINLFERSVLLGRGLSTAGAISLHNNAVNFLPESAEVITGTGTICEGQTGVVYSIPMITNAAGYIWTLPAGASITAGINTNNIIVDFSYAASSGNINVYGTNACGNGIVSPNYALTISLRPLTSAIFHQ